MELDATVICKWRSEEEGQLVYRYYCYIGARQRGSVQHFALMPLGVSKSVGEGRVNPETSDAYHAFLKQVFGNQKHNLISMTDGALCYRCRCEICQAVFEEHHWVNHSRKPLPEFSRPVSGVVSDVETGETRDAMAGTMTLDKEWGLLKDPLPANLTARTVAQVERCDLLVRAEQFRRMTSTGDRWAAFLDAARHWVQQERNPKVEIAKASLGKLASGQGRLLKGRRVGAIAGDSQAEVGGSESRALVACPESVAASLEGVMRELTIEEIEKLENACAVQRRTLADEQQRAMLSADIPASEPDAAVRLAIPAVQTFLVDRFSQIAPASAFDKYNAFVQSEAFRERLLKEVALQEDSPLEYESPELLREWLLLLVDRKEVDLAGMVVNAAVPGGFSRGKGSMAGNNCFISSVAQALLGLASAGEEHDKFCAQIRRAGMGDLWGANNFILASAETLAFISDQVLGPGHAVFLTLHSSHDGSNVVHIESGCSDTRAQKSIHIFNPTGVHFDPLWPAK